MVELTNLLLREIAKHGPILASFDDDMVPLESDERKEVAYALELWPSGETAASHYISLKTLIQCLGKLKK